MGKSDRVLRATAIPYYGQVLGYNHSENSDQDISSTYSSPTGLAPGTNGALLGIGDLQNLAAAPGGTNSTDFMVRILRPAYGQIIQAFLNISLTFDSTEPSPLMNISAGSGFLTDGITPVVPSAAYILACTSALNGTIYPFFGTGGQALTLYKLDVTPFLPQVGDPDFSSDFYVVGIHFLQAPVQTGLYHLNKFFVTGSALATP